MLKRDRGLHHNYRRPLGLKYLSKHIAKDKVNFSLLLYNRLILQFWGFKLNRLSIASTRRHHSLPCSHAQISLNASYRQRKQLRACQQVHDTLQLGFDEIGRLQGNKPSHAGIIVALFGTNCHCTLFPGISSTETTRL